MNVPFLDLKKQYRDHKTEIDKALASVISETSFVNGKFVETFEKEYGEAYGVKHCIGVANGTDALYIVMKQLGIGQGDEVITVSNTWISTSEAIGQTGAKTVFVDIEPDYYCMDVSKIEAKINKSTKAIIAVHLYGQSCDIQSIKQICEKHELFLIEDCAQSHFAEFETKKTGSFGIAACFSFYPGKNLGAYGDAGAIITNNDELAIKVRMYANHGSLIKHQHEMEGINSRLDGMQAAILSAKLPFLKEWDLKRKLHADHYTRLLADVKEVICPHSRKNCSHAFHLYVIRVQKRNDLQHFLKKSGIETQIHYPLPLPFTKAYAHLNHKPEDFPVSWKYHSEILSLPMYAELTENDIVYVTLKIKEFYNPV
jgi:dTDP-4-amino-4,6-dideoxygalactose transaminase